MSSDSCNSTPPVVVCRDHHSRNMGMSLEGILMRQHGVRYGDAKRVVVEGRKALNMSRIEPWNAALQQECERQVRTQQLGRSIRTAPPRRSVSSRSLSEARTLAPKTVKTPDDNDESSVAQPSPQEQTSEPTEVESSAKIRQHPAPEKEEPSSSMPLGTGTMDDWLNNILEKSAEDAAIQQEEEDDYGEQKISVKDKVVKTSEEGDSTEHTVDETDSQDEECSEASAATQAFVREETPVVIQEQGCEVEGGGTVTQAAVREETPLMIQEQDSEGEGGGSATQVVIREETPLRIQEPGSEEEGGGSATTASVREATPVMIQVQGSEGEDSGSPQTENCDDVDDVTNTEHCLEEETDRTEEDNDDARTQAEMMADDSSYATDNSKCFTTAKELEEDHQVLLHPTTQVAPSRPEEEQEDTGDECSVMKVNTLQPVPIADDEPTVDTSSASVDTIPSFIYILPGPPEVPEDEPLVQSYVLTQRAPAATKGGFRGFGLLRRKNNKKPQRFGLFRRNSMARLALSEDDTELRFQTLVDL